ncbi:MAG: DUF1572 family protein [Pirellulales bacterium]
MKPTSRQLAAALAAEAANELADALGKIEHCLAQLTDQQVWWRSCESTNSIGNLVLHLAGNLRQWIVSGLGGAADQRDRPSEFAQRGGIASQELLGRLRGVVGEAQAALASLSPDELLRVRRIQGFEVSGLAAIFHSVPHFRGHTQEIVHLTRLELGDAYRFAWQPATPDQGGMEG